MSHRVSAIVVATQRLHTLGYGPPSDGRGGVLHSGDGTQDVRFDELASALTRRCLYRDAEGMRELGRASMAIREALALPPGNQRLPRLFAAADANERAVALLARLP